MKLVEFLENFRYVAEAPNGVKLLRQLILDVAFSGDLVPRSVSEDVACLLECISKEIQIAAIERGIRWRPFRGATAFSLAADPPSHWRIAHLNDFALINMGQSPKTGTVQDIGREGIPFYQGKAEFGSFHPTPRKICLEPIKLAAPGDVLVSVRAPIGPSNICLETSCIGRGLASVSPMCGVDSKYLLYYFRAFERRIAGLGTGSTFKAIKQSDLQGLPVPVPPVDEQEGIIAKIDELMAMCDKLEAHQQTQEKLFPVLSNVKNAEFSDAPGASLVAGDLDNILGLGCDELRGSVLSLAVTGWLSDRRREDVEGDKLFARLIAAGDFDRPLPATWKCCRLSALTRFVTSGSRGWKQYYSLEGAIFIRTQNIKTDALILDDLQRLDLPVSTEGKRTRVQEQDVLITITGANVTKCALVDEDIGEAYVSQHIALLRPIDPVLGRWLHLCLLAPVSGRGPLEAAAYGDKPGLNLNNIRDLVFPIPPVAEQRRIAETVDRFIALIESLAQKRATKDQVAKSFADAAVAAITGTAGQESKPMKAPQTELVTRLEVAARSENPGSNEPLAALLAEQNGQLSAKELWQRSGLAIEAFYQQLKTEQAAGWIIEPEPARMREIKGD